MPQAAHYAFIVEYLIRLRLERSVLQLDLGKRLGKNQQFVSRVENKLRRLDVIEFCAYVRALGVDPEEAVAQLIRSLPSDFEI